MATDYGTDLSCLDDLTPTCTVVSGTRIVLEALYRRLITPRGRLLSDPKYGTDIRQWLNDDVTPVDLAAMQGAVQAECLKDERVSAAAVTGTAPSKTNGMYTVAIVVTLIQGETFPMTLAVSSVSVALLEQSTS